MLVIFLLAFNVYSSKDTLLLREMERLVWRDSTWENMDKYIYEYNSDLLKSLRTEFIGDGNGWKEDEQFEYKYENGNETEKIHKKWVSSGWDNYIRVVKTYDGNRLIEEIDQKYNNNAWENYSKLESEYFEKSKIKKSFVWITGNWVWDNDSYFFFYDNKDNLIKRFSVESGDTTNWYEYTYDSFDNRTESLRLRWTGTEWINWNRTVFEYNNKQLLTVEYFQSWVDSQWEDSGDSITYFYNSKNQLIEKITWEGIISSAFHKDVYSYDSLNCLIRKAGYSWRNSGWEETSREFYTYSSIVPIKNQTELKSNKQSIVMRNGILKFPENTISIEIYDFLGRQLLSRTVNPKTEYQINLKYTLNQGKIYLLKIVSNKSLVYNKIHLY